MKLLQITDPHLYGSAQGSLRGVETAASLCRVLDDALERDGDHDALLVTGDVVQDDPAGYQRFKGILGGLSAPVLCLPGNHDEPDLMSRCLDAPPFQYCGTRLLGGWQIILLNSCDPGHVGGRLSAHELTRLNASLCACDAPALVALHHHPVTMGSRWLDNIGLANAEDLWTVLDAHAHVRGIVWGHVHQAFDGERRGVRLMGTPSTCAQFLPHSDRYAVDSRPPAYRRLEMTVGGEIESEVCWIEPVRRSQAMAR